MTIGGKRISMDDVIALIEKEADLRQENAAQGGSYNDGGASVLRDQVKFYRYGRSGIFPPEWKMYNDKAVKQADPEWGTYLKLKRKFES